MGKKRHTVETIVAKLREPEVLLAKGQSIEEVMRQLGISDATYYKWRKEYGGLHIKWGQVNQRFEFLNNLVVLHYCSPRNFASKAEPVITKVLEILRRAERKSIE